MRPFSKLWRGLGLWRAVWHPDSTFLRSPQLWHSISVCDSLYLCTHTHCASSYISRAIYGSSWGKSNLSPGYLSLRCMINPPPHDLIEVHDPGAPFMIMNTRGGGSPHPLPPKKDAPKRAATASWPPLHSGYVRPYSHSGVLTRPLPVAVCVAVSSSELQCCTLYRRLFRSKYVQQCSNDSRVLRSALLWGGYDK